MKRTTVLLLLVLAFLLAACGPAVATSSAVQIPDALKIAINGLILAAVMFGLQFLFDQFGLDLRGIGATVALAVSELLILQFQGVIDAIPAQYDMAVSIGLNVLLAVLTGLGFVRAFTQRERASELTFKRGKR